MREKHPSLGRVGLGCALAVLLLSFGMAHAQFLGVDVDGDRDTDCYQELYPVYDQSDVGFQKELVLWWDHPSTDNLFVLAHVLWVEDSTMISVDTFEWDASMIAAFGSAAVFGEAAPQQSDEWMQDEPGVSMIWPLGKGWVAQAVTLFPPGVSSPGTFGILKYTVQQAGMVKFHIAAENASWLTATGQSGDFCPVGQSSSSCKCFDATSIEGISWGSLKKLFR